MNIFDLLNGTEPGSPAWTPRDHYLAGKLIGQASALRVMLRTGRHSLPLPEAERESLILALSQFLEASENGQWT